MVNQALAMNPAKTSRFGNLFHTIDFDTKGATFSDMGTLYIGTGRFRLSHDELKQLKTEAAEKRDLENEISVQGWDFKLTKHETKHLSDTLQRGEDVAFRINKLY